LLSPSPVTPWNGGVRLAVKLTPKAARDQISEVAPEADGGVVLKASVTTVPEDGKANAALIALLSKRWKIAKSRFEIVSGATDRRKTLFIADASPEELERLIAESCKR